MLTQPKTEPLRIPGLIADLYDHQVATIEKGSHNTALFDMSEPGTGKTITQIALYLKRCNTVGLRTRALVLATKSTMQAAWGDDIEKAAPSITYAVARATNRRAAFDTRADIIITNHDAVTWIKDNPEVLDGFDHLIVDESLAYKNHTSQRTKALFRICANFTYRNALSGLPNPNSVTELWAQTYMLDGGERLGTGFWKFRSTVCTPVQVGRGANHVKWEDIPGVESAVAALLEDISIRHKLEDCIDMPENVVHQHAFKLSRKHHALYNELIDRSILTLKNGTVDATNKAVLQNKLLQLLSGAVYGADGEIVDIATERYEIALDLVEARDHSICAFLYSHQKKNLVATAERRGVKYAVIDGSTSDNDRIAIVRDFQAGQYQVVFAHPQTAAHGLTMTRGTATIWCQPTFNHDWFVQFNRRIYRNGQTKRTETIVITADVPLEDRVYAERVGKEERSTNFLEYLE